MRNITNMAAVISIESDVIKMRISRVKNGEISDIDRLENPTNIGHEVFNTSKISFESLRKISEILKGYSKVLSEYGVTNYRVVASTALREAENCAYVLDQLRIQNDMTVEVLEDRQEKSLIYNEIINYIEGQGMSDALISYIGAGSIGFAIYEDGAVKFSQNIKMGSQKLHDLLGEIQSQTRDYHTVLEEYLDRIIGRVNFPEGRFKNDNLVITGNEIKIIAKICGASPGSLGYDIDTQLIVDFYDEIRDLTTEKIMDKYSLNQHEAQLFLTSLLIYLRIIKITGSSRILSPQVELWDAIIKQMLIPKNKVIYDAHVKTSTINCAVVLSELYSCDKDHREMTRKYAMEIFDKMKKIHGMGPRKRLLLELAIILHESGYCLNSKYPRESTFDIIKNLGLYGLTSEEMILVANIAKYDELTVPNMSDLEYSDLSQKNKLLVSKMVAIFRLANALDKSKKQKFQDIKARLVDQKFIIEVQSNENVYLEKWAFNKCVPFFEDVYGVNPELNVKTTLFR